jgi:hypothetical protein
MTDRIEGDAIRESRQGQSLQQEPNYWQGHSSGGVKACLAQGLASGERRECSRVPTYPDAAWLRARAAGDSGPQMTYVPGCGSRGELEPAAKLHVISR